MVRCQRVKPCLCVFWRLPEHSFEPRLARHEQNSAKTRFKPSPSPSSRGHGELVGGLAAHANAGRAEEQDHAGPGRTVDCQVHAFHSCRNVVEVDLIVNSIVRQDGDRGQRQGDAHQTGLPALGGGISILPQWVWMILWVTVRPRPSPTLRVVKNGCDALSAASALNPAPLSWTSIRAPARAAGIGFRPGPDPDLAGLCVGLERIQNDLGKGML